MNAIAGNERCTDEQPPFQQMMIPYLGAFGNIVHLVPICWLYKATFVTMSGLAEYFLLLMVAEGRRMLWGLVLTLACEHESAKRTLWFRYQSGRKV